jgi:subtilase family serine protease
MNFFLINKNLLQQKLVQQKLVQQKLVQQQKILQQQNINSELEIKNKINYHYNLTNNIITNTTTNTNHIIPFSNFNGSQLLNIYNIPTVVPTNSTTRKVIIAIIIAYRCPTIQSDLNMYWQSVVNFGPNSTPPIINIYTQPGASVNSSWNKETCLDVQMIATTNPNAKIWVVEAKSASVSDLTNAIQYATTTLNADIISCSWGGSDPKTLVNNTVFINPSNQSKYKCYCFSSGDNNSVNWPAVLSNVISVGGSTLVWNPTPNNISNHSEYTWPSAGCGYSTSVTKPTYQSSVNNNKYRAIPDISLVANQNTGINIVYNGKWSSIGGTSVSCPLFAGILSLANQQRFNLGKFPLTTVYTQTPTTNTIPVTIPLTNIQNFLYKTIYTDTTLKKNCLYDIIGGTDGIYEAGTGYDIATGLGSPNVINLCNALAITLA